MLVNSDTKSCQHFYTKLLPTPSTDRQSNVEQMGMCRLLQSMSAGGPVQKIRRMQIIASMWRAGCNEKDSDHCAFNGRYPCPYFKERSQA
jgi:hypothetical protein